MERKIENLDLSKIPFRVELVAPERKKPGLRIMAPEPMEYAYALLENGGITPALLKEVGFIIFDNENGPTQTGEYTPYESEKSQMPHQDGSNNRDPEFQKNGFVALRADPKGKVDLRNKTTGIGDKKEIFSEMVRFFNEHNEDILAESDFLGTINKLRADVTAVGIDGVDLETFSRSGSSELWMDQFFKGANILNRYPRLLELLDRLKHLMHLHRFGGKPQLLIIDNVDAVHDRIADDENETDTLPPSLRVLTWDDKGKIRPYQARGSY